jgi:hypothetical protein
LAGFPALASLGRSPGNRLSAIAISGSPLRHRHLLILKYRHLAGFPALAFARAFAGQSPAGD